MNPKGETDKSSSLLIELKNITRSFGYGETESFALNDFNLEVKPGEFIMIMGPSGCGKTTLLNIIGLLDFPTSGSYYLDSERTTYFSKSYLAHIRAQKIGFIFQDFNLIPKMTILENVSLPLLYAGIPKTKRLVKSSEILSYLNLQEREYYYPYQLSGGQKQRAAIARALVSSPEIILADEPTGNLDSRNAHLVMEELRRIHSEGNTIIMVTHNPNLTSYATRVIHMLDGRIDTDVKTVADEDLPDRIKVNFHSKKRSLTQPPSNLSYQTSKLSASFSSPAEKPNLSYKYPFSSDISTDKTTKIVVSTTPSTPLSKTSSTPSKNIEVSHPADPPQSASSSSTPTIPTQNTSTDSTAKIPKPSPLKNLLSKKTKLKTKLKVKVSKVAKTAKSTKIAKAIKSTKTKEKGHK